MVRADKISQIVQNKLQSLSYSGLWGSYSEVEEVTAALAHASKSGSGEPGYPDHVYANPISRLLIMVEDKDSISQHRSPRGDSPADYAVDGILHYLSCFIAECERNELLGSFFKSWNVIGVAVSGNVEDEYSSIVSTFLVRSGAVVEDESIGELLSEDDYLRLFSSINLDEVVSQVSASSRLINRLLRSVDSQKRPILLSALMICLYPTKELPNDFKANYMSYSAPTIVSNIVPTLEKVLEEERIPKKRIEVIKNELAFLATENDLNDPNQSILKDILRELSTSVIPLFSMKTDYDIVGKFYEEFLRFAGVSNVKKGIVLTPRHITTLFPKLVDLKYNDVVVDFACGTGAFLIAAMNELIRLIDASPIPSKSDLRESVKLRQLVGFEKNATMYTCALSNMMFHGDGKSNIEYCDCFSSDADKFLEDLEKQGIKPTIGFINPPYGGKDNRTNPTKKEVQFLARMLDAVSRYGVIIAPLSMYLKDNTVRNAILSKHTLKCVINMPPDLFMPNAATQTAIGVFETHRPHDDSEVVFCKLDDDGLVLSKAKGRVDVFNRWGEIENNLLEALAHPQRYENGVDLVCRAVGKGDEWLLQAYAQIDYSTLSTAMFEDSIKQRISYVARRDMGVLNKRIDEVTCSEILFEYYNCPFMRSEPLPVDVSWWKPFKISDLFIRYNGARLTKAEMTGGSTNFLGAIQGNNGVREQIGEEPIFQGGTITVNYNGSVGEAFYQSEPYWPSDDVYTLELKDEFGVELDIRISMFLITMIKLHKQNYFYGRKWSSDKMEESEILLPADEGGKPDWDYMSGFISGLPYAGLLK